MGRRAFGRGDLLLAVLGVLEGGPMTPREVFARLEMLLGDEYRLTHSALLVALEALHGEELVERVAQGYRMTPEGGEALRGRDGAEVLQRLGHRAEHVTILFTDVVGSTELLDRLGDATAHDLRRRHFALLRAAVCDHRGREVKSLGDGLMVAFGSPSAAVECAQAMQLAVAACDDGLELRVGIASGEAVREDGDYFGRPVIVAKRLCDAARAGEVLVSGPAEERFEPVGPLALKGLSEPVSASAMRPRPLALTA
jgi:class 3 adenylate cyclase